MQLPIETMAEFQDTYRSMVDAEQRTVGEMIAQGCGPSEIVANAHWFASYSFEQLFTKVEHAPQCQQGCHYCCRLPVDTTEAELDFVLDRIDPVTLNLDGPDCPFLKNKECQVYDRRPLMCRGWHSLDVSRCKLAYDTGDGSLTVPVFGYAYLAGTATLDGLIAGLRANRQVANRRLMRDLLRERKGKGE